MRPAIGSRARVSLATTLLAATLPCASTARAQTPLAIEVGPLVQSARYGGALGVEDGWLYGASATLRLRSRLFFEADARAADLPRSYAVVGWSRRIGVRHVGARVGAVLLDPDWATLSVSAGPSVVFTRWHGGGPSDGFGVGAVAALRVGQAAGWSLRGTAGVEGFRVFLPWYGRVETYAATFGLGVTYRFRVDGCGGCW